RELHTGRAGLAAGICQTLVIVGHHRRAAAYVRRADTRQPGGDLRAVARTVTLEDCIRGAGNHRQGRIHNGHGPGATALVAAGISRRELHTGRTGLAAGITQTRVIVGHHCRAAAYVGRADTGQPGSDLRAVTRTVTLEDRISRAGNHRCGDVLDGDRLDTIGLIIA